MRPVFRLTWKEMRELFRPRYILPILFVPLVFVAIGGGVGGIEEQLAREPTVGIVNADDGDLGRIVAETVRQGSEVVYESGEADPAAALSAVRGEGGSTVVVIPPEFTERVRAGKRGQIELYTSVESVSVTGIAASSRVEGLLDAASRRVTMAVTGASAAQLDPIERSHVTFVKGTRADVSPGALSAAFSASFLFVPLLIMFVIFLSGQMVINSMGIEKESKTLETLLTMPVARRTIVVGKLLGSASVGLFAAALYTGSIYYYQTQVGFGGGADLGAFGLAGMDYVLIGIALFLALIGGLALTLCLGVFVEDRQAAQLFVVPLGVLVFVPLILTVVADFETLSLPVQAVVFLIPFTNPIIAPKQLTFGGAGIVLAGIAYQALFAIGAVAVAVRLFESDRLVTGSTGRLGNLLGRLQR